MKADPVAQAALLDVQVVDTRVSEIDRLLVHPPETARLQELAEEFASLSDVLRVAVGVLEDVQAEVARVEADIQVAQTRRDRDRLRLDQSSNSKEIQGLTSELDTLARRIDTLEEAQLELMQREEEQSAEVARVREQRESLRAEGESLRASQAEVLGTLSAEREGLLASRAAIVTNVSEELLALYEKIRSRGYGVGAARLQNRVCGACGIQLGPADMASLQKLSVADVAQCPQCDAILIRGAV